MSISVNLILISSIVIELTLIYSRLITLTILGLGGWQTYPRIARRSEVKAWDR